MSSLQVLLTGWAGFYLGGPMLTWFANPLLFLSWITIYNWRPASLITSLLATAICISFLFFNEIYNHNIEFTGKITDIKLGYWLWTSSAFVMLIGNVWLAFIKSQSNVLK
ncbi:MAG: hypothetical protein EOP46_21490 [Sphingobacteriaceae bacterium]|nr:MAG: hypothetical protein EOP46_21490 [Sphingobacteriaceae bacterium]